MQQAACGTAVAFRRPRQLSAAKSTTRRAAPHRFQMVTFGMVVVRQLGSAARCSSFARPECCRRERWVMAMTAPNSMIDQAFLGRSHRSPPASLRLDHRSPTRGLLPLIEAILSRLPTRKLGRYSTDANESRSGYPQPETVRLTADATRHAFGVYAVFRRVPPRASLPQRIQQIAGVGMS